MKVESVVVSVPYLEYSLRSSIFGPFLAKLENAVYIIVVPWCVDVTCQHHILDIEGVDMADRRRVSWGT